MRAKLLPAIGLCLSLTAEAQAQAPASDDMAYCAQLSALYRRYLGNTGEGRTFPDVAAATAMANAIGAIRRPAFRCWRRSCATRASPCPSGPRPLLEARHSRGAL